MTQAQTKPDDLKTVIAALAAKAKSTHSSVEAAQYAQAALNLAHAAATLHNMK